MTAKGNEIRIKRCQKDRLLFVRNVKVEKDNKNVLTEEKVNARIWATVEKVNTRRHRTEKSRVEGILFVASS